MRAWLAAYGVSAAVFLALDGVWLTQVGPRLYRPTLDPVLAVTPSLAPAALFYLVYLFGVVALAVAPNRGAGLGHAARAGAILGLVAYATYDLTNQATLQVWASRISLIDMGWGVTVTAAAATAGLAAWRWASSAARPGA